MKRFAWIALILLWLTACTPAQETAVSTPQPSPATAVPPTVTVPPPIITETVTEIAEATAVPNPTATPPDPTAEPTTESGVVSGRTAEGAFFLGDPNAPITHIDYSDFL